MPWETDLFRNLVDKAKEDINSFFGIKPKVNVLICSYDEMKTSLIQDFETRNLPAKILEFHLNYTINDVIGKYFSDTKTILILENFSDHYFLLIHELLHSIQKCHPHREAIVDYISFIISKDERAIDSQLLYEWLQIEKNYGEKSIIKQLLLEKDCEEF